MSRFYEILIVSYCVYKNLPLVSTQRELNPVHAAALHKS
jgi:hypothetical protein